MYGARIILILGIDEPPIAETGVDVRVERCPHGNIGSGIEAIVSIFGLKKMAMQMFCSYILKYIKPETTLAYTRENLYTAIDFRARRVNKQAQR